MTQKEVLDFNIANKSKVYGGVIDNPKTIQEKLRWLNIYEVPWSEDYNMPLKSVCADKLLMKEYVKNLLRIDICVPTIAVYNNTKEIEWDKLPNKFIIKVNHNSGGTLICKDKNKFDKNNCISKLNYWMNDDFAFRNGFESHYHWIDRKIIVEELLEDENQKDSLYDYKFWCFNGEPKLYTINDGHGHGDIMYYKMDDSEYNLYNIQNNLKYKKPKNFDLMVSYSKIISETFKFVRVDFYEVNNQVYLGEITFVPGAAMFKYKLNGADLEVGNMLKIN